MDSLPERRASYWVLSGLAFIASTVLIYFVEPHIQLTTASTNANGITWASVAQILGIALTTLFTFSILFFQRVAETSTPSILQMARKDRVLWLGYGLLALHIFFAAFAYAAFEGRLTFWSSIPILVSGGGILFLLIRHILKMLDPTYFASWVAGNIKDEIRRNVKSKNSENAQWFKGRLRGLLDMLHQAMVVGQYEYIEAVCKTISEVVVTFFESVNVEPYHVDEVCTFLAETLRIEAGSIAQERHTQTLNPIIDLASSIRLKTIDLHQTKQRGTMSGYQLDYLLEMIVKSTFFNEDTYATSRAITGLHQIAMFELKTGNSDSAAAIIRRIGGYGVSAIKNERFYLVPGISQHIVELTQHSLAKERDGLDCSLCLNDICKAIDSYVGAVLAKPNFDQMVFVESLVTGNAFATLIFYASNDWEHVSGYMGWQEQRMDFIRGLNRSLCKRTQVAIQANRYSIFSSFIQQLPSVSVILFEQISLRQVGPAEIIRDADIEVGYNLSSLIYFMGIALREDNFDAESPLRSAIFDLFFLLTYIVKDRPGTYLSQAHRGALVQLLTILAEQIAAEDEISGAMRVMIRLTLELGTYLMTIGAFDLGVAVAFVIGNRFRQRRAVGLGIPEFDDDTDIDFDYIPIRASYRSQFSELAYQDIQRVVKNPQLVQQFNQLAAINTATPAGGLTDVERTTALEQLRVALSQKGQLDPDLLPDLLLALIAQRDPKTSEELRAIRGYDIASLESVESYVLGLLDMLRKVYDETIS